ncbi:MAG: pyridoxal phosphate-dependent aminotransferase [Eubacterium sp.]|nr:pyridoxal phosphate-dependent aminotransferase [Eubacterium sp.]
MKYNFDEIIDRTNTNSMNVDGWRHYIFKDDPHREFPFADNEFIRMWVADMEFAVAPEIREAIKERVDRQILGYSAVTDPEYYEAVFEWCKTRYDLTFPKRHLVFSQGVVPALYQLVEDLVGAGEKVITFTPAYGYFLHACEYSGTGLLESPLASRSGRYEIDFDDLEKKAADPSARMLILCNPHNPTGTVWSREELERVAGIAARNGLWIISDEIHCDLLRTGLRHTPMANIMPDYDRLITCMSASKSFNLAGMMHSHIIIRNEEERARFRSRDKTGGALNPLSIAAHKAAYSRGAQWLDALRSYLDDNFRFTGEFLAENIPDAGFSVPDATYFAWVDFSKVLPDEKSLPLFFAERAGVLLEGGNELFVGNAEGCVRLNLAMPRAMLKTGLERMAGSVAH